MEEIQQISNESFSHGWPNNTKQRSLEFLEESLGRSFDALDAASFIEMDLDFFSMRWTDSLDFNFSHPSGGGASLAPAMNDADQIFFNGSLLPPLHLVNQGPIASPDSVLLPPSKSSPCQSESDFSAYSDPAMTPGRFGNRESARSPAKILKKYLYFLVPLYKKVKKLKMISSKAPRRFDCSSRRSCRRTSNAGLTGDDRRRPANRIFDVEAASSIHDAVLHCKKSNGNSSANSG